ncbi:ATP-binding protein [Microbacterium sp. NPDC055665]
MTLVGPAGVGKTRIAIRVARRVGSRFSDGVVFVDLVGITTGRQLLDAVTSAVGVHVANADTGSALLTHLSDKKMLIVLDNCEHLVELAAEFASALRQSCSGISLLATSREELRIPWEHVLFVAPFAIHCADKSQHAQCSAVQLFIDRAKPFVRVPVSPADLDTIARICDQLDGLPLAIELAAARIPVLSLEQLLVELRHPLQVATRSSRHGDVRHQSLRGAIEWSYDLCNRYEQGAWRCFSVFGESWDLEAGTAVLDHVMAYDVPSVDIHQALLEKSIIQRVEGRGPTRYSLLASMRRFGREKLTAMESQSAQRAHRNWHVHRLRQAEADWLSPRQAEWLEYFRYELPNIRVAAEFSLTDHEHPDELFDLLSVGWRLVWQADGRTNELRDWLSRALSLGHGPSPSRSMALCLYALVDGRNGDVESALKELAALRLEVERSGDALLLSYVDGAIAQLLPDAETAVDLYVSALAVQDGNPVAVARGGTAVQLAQTLERLGRTAEAETLRNRLLTEAEVTGEQYEISELLLNSGAAALRRDELDTAADLTRRALAMQRRLRNAIGIGHAIRILAGICLRGGAPGRCAYLLGAAQSAWPTSGMASPRIDDRDAEIFEQEARAILGQEKYKLRFDSGARLTLEKAIAQALGEPVIGAPYRRAKSRALTAREEEVAALVAEGLSDREIAKQLMLSVRTVHGHVQHVFSKLALTSRTQIAIWRTRDNGSDARPED